MKKKKTASLSKLGSTSSERTDESTRSEHILALGRKLVEELGLDHSTDTLSRWMAHHIAELIAKTENAKLKDKDVAEKNCFEAILTLWAHRTKFPNGKRPFEDLEPVIRAIESLDPDNNMPRYFPNARVQAKEIKEQSEADRWLAIVDGLDYSAKVLIGFCLSEAAKTAVDKSKEWIKLVESVDSELNASEITIRFVLDNLDFGKVPDPNGEARKQLQERIKRLEDFTTLAKSVVRDLKTRLKNLPILEENDGTTVEKEPEP